MLIQYVVLIVLSIGMCLCLRQANRLIPNRFSFPLVDRRQERQRGLYDLGVEEEGLLSHYSDVEDEDDAEVIPDQTLLPSNRHEDEENFDEQEEEEEEFSTLQQHQKSSSIKNQKKRYVYNDDEEEEEEEEENELYKNPYKDDD
jgi:hypothetical protein